MTRVGRDSQKTLAARGRPRAFDWDEARSLRAAGMTYKAIAAQLGVSANSVAKACDPAYRKRQYENVARLLEAGRTPCRGGCGVLVWTAYSPQQSGYCLACLGEKRRAENGPQHGTESEYRAGCRCGDCRRAASEAKRQRRLRSRVQCSHGCGTLVEGINRRDSGKPPECNPCALKRIHAERRAAA